MGLPQGTHSGEEIVPRRGFPRAIDGGIAAILISLAPLAGPMAAGEAQKPASVVFRMLLFQGLREERP